VLYNRPKPDKGGKILNRNLPPKPPLINMLNKRVLKIQGRQEEIDLLVREYKPFILSTVQKSTGKNYITEQDDEYSIALMAFAEAVRLYREDKGNFLAFAANVIRMRCIDYYRKEKKHWENLAYPDSDEDKPEDNLLYKQAIDNHALEDEARLRAMEIEQYQQELANWGISLNELVRLSPKHKNTRQQCGKIVAYLQKDRELLRQLFQKKQLPLADIVKNIRVPRKLAEKFRKYIIASCIDYKKRGLSQP